MDRERFEELEEEEAQGVEVFREIHDEPRRERIEREEAEGVEVYSDPDSDLLEEQEMEEAEGYDWIPERESMTTGDERGGAKVSAERVRRYLMTHGVHYEIGTHPEAFTAQEVAAAEHVTGFEVAKPVLLESAGHLVMAVLPATCKVDLEKARVALRAPELRLASEAEFSPRFPDCERGAEPPFGNLYGLPTYVDHRLKSEQITFTAGSHTETITMGRDDYLDIVKPEVIDLAVDE